MTSLCLGAAPHGICVHARNNREQEQPRETAVERGQASRVNPFGEDDSESQRSVKSDGQKAQGGYRGCESRPCFDSEIRMGE